MVFWFSDTIRKCYSIMKKYIVFCVLIFPMFVRCQSLDSSISKRIDSLLRKALEYTEIDSFDRAIHIAAVAEKYALKHAGAGSLVYAKTCYVMGLSLDLTSDFENAITWYVRSNEIVEKRKGKQNSDYVKTLYNLADLYIQMGQVNKAEQAYLQCASLREKLVGIHHPDYVATIEGLAELYMDIGKYDTAEEWYHKIISIREKLNGKDHNDYIYSLNNLAVLYQHMGKYDKAEPLYREVLDFQARTLVGGTTNPEYLRNLQNLAILYFESGAYDKAEPLYLECKDQRKRTEGAESLNYASCLNGLAILYRTMGNIEKAEPLFLEAIQIYIHENAQDSHEYGSVLNNLANLYIAVDNLEEALPLYEEAISVYKKAKGEQSNEYTTGLSNLANLYLEMGLFKKAELLLLETKEKRAKRFGTLHPDYISSLISLGALYPNLGDSKKAESFLLEAQRITKKTLGVQHPYYLTCLTKLVKLYEEKGRYSESTSMLKEMEILEKEKLYKALRFLSETELAKYAALFLEGADDLASYTLNRFYESDVRTTNELSLLLYDRMLFYKGLLLTSSSQLNAELIKGAPEIREIAERLKEYKRQMAAELSLPQEKQRRYNELEDTINTIEKQLVRYTATMNDPIRKISWKNVRDALKKDEAAIEFIDFAVNVPSLKDSIMYAALIIRAGDTCPHFIPLLEERSLDSLIGYDVHKKADYVNRLYSLADRGAVALETPKKSLYEILWHPIEKELTGVKTIYFSPSGLLHRINLDAIPLTETETLADRYNLIALNSTRQLVIPGQMKQANNDAVLYGGIQFEQDNALQNNEPMLASISRGELAFENVDSTLRGGSWNYLAGTEREVKAIENIMRTTGVQTQVKKGYEATEESFKNIGTKKSVSPRILHIATHGYFFPDLKTEKETFLNSEPVFKIADHPMLRSGLIMAGGNAAWQGKQTAEGREDGVLTAYEISQMNLSNTELVVLSACETGLGDIQGNEGVYGLQRAFKIAGVKYIIMSLWQVPDKQTSLLMTTFYKKLLEAEGPDKGGNKKTIPDAFHAAQKELRDNGLDPYNWAGFVLVE